MTSHIVKTTLLGLELLADIEYEGPNDWQICQVTLGGNEVDWRDSEDVFVTSRGGKTISLGQYVSDLAADKVETWEDERRCDAAEARGEAA